MNVQELCTLLRERLVEELTEVQTGSSSSIPIPDEVKTDKFLADNIADVFKAVAKQEGTDAELVGSLEINAFLAAFQRAHEHENMESSINFLLIHISLLLCSYDFMII